MQKTGHSLKKRAISLGLSAALTFSLLGGAIPFGAEAEAAAVGISNDSLKVSIGDLGQISTMNIVNNRTNRNGQEINFVLPNTERNQNNADHQWMGEMIFAYRTSDDADFSDSGNFVEVDTNKTLAVGGSTTASNINPDNPYIKKEVSEDNKQVVVDFVGQDLDSTAKRAMKGFDVQSVYNMDTEDGSLEWTIKVRNKSEKYIEFGDIGLPMPWNNKYANTSDTYNNRMTVHTFAGADSGYAYAIRCSGEGNFMMFTPVVESGARIEYVDNWIRAQNGITGHRAEFNNWCGDGGGWYPGLSVYYIHSKNISKISGSSYFTDNSSLVLAPGEEESYTFKFSAIRAGDNTPGTSSSDYNNASDSMEEREANMRSIMYESGMIDAVAVPSFQTAINMPTKLDLHYDSDKVTDVKLDIQCVHENDPFDEEHIPGKSDRYVNNNRGGRGEHDANPGYEEAYRYVETTIDEKGEEHHIYELNFACIGNTSVRVDYKVGGEDKFTQFEFNVLAELDEAAETHAEFMMNEQQDNDPNSPTYGMYNDWYLSTGADKNARTHWGDDWGHDNINFMTMKNYLNPDPEQVQSIEKYLIDYMWNNYMKYSGKNYWVANYLSASGIYGTSEKPYSRVFGDMMEATGFFNMYRIQKAYPDLIEYRESPQFYLEKAYGIYYNRVGSGTTGFYGEQQVPDIIEALYAEGMTKEGDNLKQKFAYTKGRNMANAAYPYGSEFEYDNTGEEGAYAATKALRYYYPDDNRAELALSKMQLTEWKTRAMRGIQPTWYHYADPVFRGGESWWNFQYTASLAGSIMDDWLRYDNPVQDDTNNNAWASRVNYGAKISNFNAINMGQISDKSIGATAWRYTMSKGNFGAQNVNDGGTRLMNNGWNDFSGEADEGLYGSLLRISADVVSSDPIFGLVGYGSTVTEADGRFTIIPKDGFGKRINLINERVFVNSEQDSITQAVISEDGTYFDLTVKNLIGIEHLSKITLDGAGMQDGYYSIQLNGEAAGQVYVHNSVGVAYIVMPADETAKVIIEKMESGENQAPTISSIKASADDLKALVPFTLEAVAYDDGAPNSTLTYKWEVVSTPDGATLNLDTTDNYFTTATSKVGGEFMVKVTVSDGELETVETITLNLADPPERMDPTIDSISATQDFNTSFAALSATATADEFYEGQDDMTYEWTVAYSPLGTTAVIGNADKADAKLKVSAPGEYILRLKVTDVDKFAVAEVKINMTGDVDGSERPENIFTQVGTAPTLPEKVEVIHPDGTVENAEVTWDAVSPEQYAEEGEFIVNGVVTGTEMQVKLLVYVMDAKRKNQALAATPDAIYNDVGDLGGVTMLNNGITPRNSRDTSNGAWHNWRMPNNGQALPAWVEYTWDEPIVATGMDVYVFKDGSGNFQPKDMRLTVTDEDGNEFTPRFTEGLGNDLDKYNTTTFEPIKIKSMRIDMNPVTLGCGILEWKVYGYSNLSVADKSALRLAYDSTNNLQATYLVGGNDAIKALADAKAAAKAVIDNANATEEDIQTALANLTEVAKANLISSNGNLAQNAGLTASFTSGHESLPAVRDEQRVNSSKHWGTWGNSSASEWIQYTWPGGAEILFSDLYIWNDRGGIKTPPKYVYSYLPLDAESEEEWVTLPEVTSGITANANNRTRFEEPLKVRALRCTLTKAANDSEGVGLWEWSIYEKLTDEITTLYNTVADVENNNYTTNSWTAFTAARDAAKAMIDASFEGTSQEQIDEAYEALDTAYKALVEKASKGEIDMLDDLTVAYSELEESKYTPATWADFKLALDAAKELIEDPDNATSQAVADAQTALTTAYNALEAKAIVYEPLQKQLDLVKAEMEKYGDTWIPASVEYVQRVIDKAEETLAKEDLTAEESQAMILELVEAMSYVFEKGNKVDLQYYVDSIENLLEDKYTPDSWKALMDAVEAAQAVLDDENATDEDIAPVYDALRAAIRNLKAIANTSELKIAIDLAQNILDNADKYIAETLEGLQEELDKANAVFANGNATQDEVDAAYNALMAQINKVRMPVDKAALLAALEEAESYDLAKYTAASGEVLSAAIIAAHKVYDNQLADQKMVDDAKNALDAAVNGLVLRSGDDTPTPDDTKEPDNSKEPDDSKEPNGGNDTPTGDSGVMAIAAMALLSGAALMLAKKRREK